MDCIKLFSRARTAVIGYYRELVPTFNFSSDSNSPLPSRFHSLIIFNKGSVYSFSHLVGWEIRTYYKKTTDLRSLSALLSEAGLNHSGSGLWHIFMRSKFCDRLLGLMTPSVALDADSTRIIRKRYVSADIAKLSLMAGLCKTSLWERWHMYKHGLSPLSSLSPNRHYSIRAIRRASLYLLHFV